jgi:hypothetical protein
MKHEREFFAADATPWEPIEGQPGLSERILAGGKDAADQTRMLRFDPGTLTAKTLTHDFWEEVWIVEGAIRDLRLDEEFTAGMYACRPPGMEHGPWESLAGCVTFEVRYTQ